MLSNQTKLVPFPALHDLESFHADFGSGLSVHEKAIVGMIVRHAGGVSVVNENDP